jgi:hypothetical protein
MAAVWLTYSWKDNEGGDIDYLAQQLRRAGLTIKLDRWNIAAGQRLWTQIDHFISSPSESDAWLLIATQNSLQSEPCKEEFAYALNRALNTRGRQYPVLALFLGPVESSLIPAAIASRLYVSVTDPDWKERIIAAVSGKPLGIPADVIQPFHLKVHRQGAGDPYVIEVRPRAGVWAPFVAAIPADEKDAVNMRIMTGPRDIIPRAGMTTLLGEGLSPDGRYWSIKIGDEATPTRSSYIWCNRLPSKFIFGSSSQPTLFQVGSHDLS